MKVTVTGRHMELSDALRNYIENGLQKLEAHFDKLTDANVVLDVQKHRHMAEVTLNANGVRIHGREVSADMYASVDSVINKLDKQVRKYRERINRHQPRASISQDYGHAIYSLNEGNGQEPAEESTPANLHREIHREKLPMKPMNVDEAVMQLDLVDEPFLVFSNADTARVNVLYARDDGTYGLIEPDF